MKKLLLLIAMLFTLSACQDKEQVMAFVNFGVATDGTQTELDEIVKVLKSKGLPVGEKIEVVVEGTTDFDKLNARVKRILNDLTVLCTAEELAKACPSGSYVRYFAVFSVSSGQPIGQVIMSW